MKRIIERTKKYNLESITSFNFGVFYPRDKEDLSYGLDDVFIKRAITRRFSLEIGGVEEGLEQACKGLRHEAAIGLLSIVNTTSREMHLPMIDYKDANFPLIAGDSTTHSSPGMFIASGNSYHHYGFKLLTPEEWRDNLHMLTETNNSLAKIDNFWASMQLEEGYSMLRITPSSNRPFQPTFICEDDNPC